MRYCNELDTDWEDEEVRVSNDAALVTSGVGGFNSIRGGFRSRGGLLDGCDDEQDGNAALRWWRPLGILDQGAYLDNIRSKVKSVKRMDPKSIFAAER